MPAIPGPDGLFQRMPRQQVLLAAEICGFGGGTPTKHRIKDLSTTGARVDRAAMLKPGSTVLVSVGVLEAIGATVVWVKDAVAGLNFAEPIDPEAARSKTILSSNSQLGLRLKVGAANRNTADGLGSPPSAGWAHDLANPYRK